MNRTSPAQVRALIGELGIQPRRALGQNFLIDRNVLDILIGAAGLTATDRVLEIGPGLGTVTERLLAVAARVVAVEKDRGLHAYLGQAFADQSGLELLCGDVPAEIDPLQWFQGGAGDLNKVVANLPYSAGSRILMTLAQAPAPPERIVVTVQDEVAQRMVAAPASRDYGLMTVWLGLHYEGEYVKTVSGNCFYPRPEVQSGIVVLRRRPRALTAAEEAAYFLLTKAAFLHRRKQLVTTLPRAELSLRLDRAQVAAALTAAGMPQDARPEALAAGHWMDFVRHLVAGQPGDDDE